MIKIEINKRDIIKTLVFISVGALLLWYSSIVLGFSKGSASYTREKYNEYKSLSRNSIDVLFVGSSATDRYWIPAIGWEEAGITSFDLTIDGGPLNLYPELIEEALKTQTPELVVIELRRAYRDSDSFKEFRVRRLTDVYLHGSTLRSAENEILATAKKFDDTDIDYTDKSYGFTYLKNHNNWRFVEFDDFYNLFPKTNQMGYLVDFRSVFWKTSEQEYPELTNEKAELSEYSEDAINRVLDYCDELDCEVLFTLTPMSSDKDRLALLNSARELVNSRGYDVLDMNTEEFYESVNLSFKTDFYNDDHTNFKGAVKISKGILNYLEENYTLNNHKNESKYEKEWGNLYDELKEIVKKNREEWMALLD